MSNLATASAMCAGSADPARCCRGQAAGCGCLLGRAGLLASVAEAAAAALEGAEAHVAGVDGVHRLDGHPPDAVLQAQAAEPTGGLDDVAPAGNRVHVCEEPVPARAERCRWGGSWVGVGGGVGGGGGSARVCARVWWWRDTQERAWVVKPVGPRGRPPAAGPRSPALPCCRRPPLPAPSQRRTPALPPQAPARPPLTCGP